MDGTGRVVFFDAKRNFGFIEPDDDSGDVSFALMPGDEALVVGDNVAYELARQPDVTSMGKSALRVWKVGFVASSSSTPVIPTEPAVTAPAAPAAPASVADDGAST